MNKRFAAVFMMIVMVFSMAACGAKSENAAGTKNSGTGKTETYEPEGVFNIRVFAAAGGIADTISRIMAQGLQTEYGVTTVVNNLTGANGAIAIADLDSYDPSPNELALVNMTIFTMAPIMNKDIQVKLDDYEIVGSLIKDEFILLVAADSGIKSWADLVAYGEEKQIIFASNTPGGSTHIVQTALFGEAGLDAQALTSDGSNKDILAVMSKDAICTSTTASLAQSYVESGELIPIAIFSEEAYTGYEGIEVPAIKSLGYDITLPSYNYLICRAGVDQAEIKGLYEAILKCRETDSFKTQAKNANYIPDDTTGKELRAEIEKYKKVCQEIYDKYY